MGTYAPPTKGRYESSQAVGDSVLNLENSPFGVCRPPPLLPRGTHRLRTDEP